MVVRNSLKSEQCHFLFRMRYDEGPHLPVDHGLAKRHTENPSTGDRQHFMTSACGRESNKG